MTPDEHRAGPFAANDPIYGPEQVARTDANELLRQVLARCSPHDPHKNRSNAGRWVTVNAPTDLIAAIRAHLETA